MPKNLRDKIYLGVLGFVAALSFSMIIGILIGTLP